MNICVFGAARDEIGENFMALGTALGRLRAENCTIAALNEVTA